MKLNYEGVTDIKCVKSVELKTKIKSPDEIYEDVFVEYMIKLLEEENKK